MKELRQFLKANKDEVLYLSLYPPTGSTVIEKDNNICYVTIAGVEHKFEGITEKIYDKLVLLYDWREKRFIKHT